MARCAGCVLWLVLGVVSCAPLEGPLQSPRLREVASGPGALAVDREGNVYVGVGCVEKMDAGGRLVTFDVGVGRPEAMVADEVYLYVADGGVIRRFSLAGGKEAAFTGGKSAIAVEPGAVRAMDVAGTTLYVADALAGEVRMFDSETGEEKGSFSAPLPTALAVDAIGQIWVAHDHGTVRAFRADGYAGVTYGGLEEVSATAFGPGGKLYVADSKSGRVMTPGTGDSGATFVTALDDGAGAEDWLLRAVAADDKGNVVTLQTGRGNGRARVAKWSATGKLLWASERSTSQGGGRN